VTYMSMHGEREKVRQTQTIVYHSNQSRCIFFHTGARPSAHLHQRPHLPVDSLSCRLCSVGGQSAFACLRLISHVSLSVCLCVCVCVFVCACLVCVLRETPASASVSRLVFFRFRAYYISQTPDHICVMHAPYPASPL